MPLAREVAAELRELADALDKEPETALSQLLIFDTVESKDVLLAYARLMPRPFSKEYRDWCGSEIIALEYKSPSVRFLIHAPRNLACRILRPAIPAEYDCEPLLTELEATSVGAETGRA